MTGKRWKCAECGKWSGVNVGNILAMCSDACVAKARERRRAAFDPRADEFDGSALQAAARMSTGGREAIGAFARLVTPPSLMGSVEAFLARMKAEAEKLKDE